MIRLRSLNCSSINLSNLSVIEIDTKQWRIKRNIKTSSVATGTEQYIMKNTRDEWMVVYVERDH